MKNNRNFQNMEIGRSLWIFTKKIPLVMKLFIFYLFCSISMLQAVESYAQNARLSLNVEEETVANILQQIENASDFDFFYNNSHVDLDRRVSISAYNSDIFTILNEVFEGTGVHYTVLDKKIILSTELNSQQQTNLIRGKVIDTNGNPITGATIKNIKYGNGTITDLDGAFSIQAQPNTSIEISFIGYKTEIIKVTTQKDLTITLKEENEMLDEVVVVGYGTVKKSNLTGAVSSVKMEEVPQIGTVSVTNMLQGRIPGLSIRSSSAAPEGGFNLTIRGAASTGAGNTPLFVIDGFPGGDINTINPVDIESVEVLKDASATAIYGARAANGVILVNTKKGKKGTMNINFRANTSFQTMSKPYEMMSAKDYMNLSNAFFEEEWLYNNKIAPYGNTDPSTVTTSPKVAFTPEQIANAKDVTDWFDEITRTGFINEESFSINGGNGNIRYLFSLSHFGQEGVVINSGVEKYIGRLNLEIDLCKWLTTGVSISANQTDLSSIGQSSSPTSPGMIRDAMYYPQYLPVYDEEGNYLVNPDHPVIANPVSWKEVESKTKSFRMLTNNFWRANITKNLTFNLNWGVNSQFKRYNSFYPKSHLFGKENNTSASINDTRNNDYLLDATLTYSKSFSNKHDLKVMAGYAYQKFISEEVSAGNSDFLTDVFGPHNLGAGGNLTKSVGSSKSITKYLSYFGRINYDIVDKYLFTFTLRADGSDKFGTNHRFGYFPSGAFAWRIIEEPFMKQQNIMSNLKFRLSVGQTGNASIGGNAYGFYAAGANYVLGNTIVAGVSENQLPNPNLKWETTTEYNVGLDFGFWTNRLTGSIDYYYKEISDLLDKRPVGSYYPVSSVADNLGRTKSSGFEVQLSSINISTKDFMWMTDLNMHRYYDAWVERNPYSILSVYETDKAPLHVKYGYLSDGLIQEGEIVPHMPDAPAGSIKIKDINGWLKDEAGNYILDEKGRKQLSGTPDNMIDDADKTIIQNEAPDLFFGLGNTFQYKGFDLSIFFYGEIGRQLYNNTKMDFLRADRFRFGDNVTLDAFERWTSQNPSGKYPSGLYTKYESSTDFWVENADYIRLKNLTIGYTLPKKAYKGIFKKARFYADAQNLFVITNYTGSDPETDSFSAYPNQKTFSIGVELSF